MWKIKFFRTNCKNWIIFRKYFRNETNKNRTLDKDLAIKRNDRLLEAYNDCTKRVIINCYKDIKDKQEKVIEEIEKILANS